MKLESIKIKDFRQFYGEQPLLEFSSDNSKMVTVIHGANGSGKTTLLNAFRWVLYGKSDYQIDKIPNQRLVSESTEGDKLSVFVELTFYHESQKYTARRERTYKKVKGLEVSSEQEKFTLNFYSKGAYEQSKNPGTHIKQILPEDLHSYFFFDGERIKNLSAPNKSSEIKSAIKKLLGLEIIERGKLHLKEVMKEFTRQLKANSSNELKAKIEELEKKEEKKQDIQNLIDTCSNNIDAFERDVATIDSKLEGKKIVAGLHNERKELETESLRLTQKRDTLKEERRNLISKEGFIALSTELVQTSEDILLEKRVKGEIPGNIREQFLDDLLSIGNCICGRSIEEKKEPQAYAAIKKLQESTVPLEIENAVITTSGDLRNLKYRKISFIDSLKKYQRDLTEIKDTLDNHQGRIDEISDKIGNVQHEEVEKLEHRRRELKSDRDSNVEKRALHKKDFEEIRKEIIELSQEIKKVKKQSDEFELAKTRLQLAEDSYELIGKVYDAISDKIRAELSARVNNTFISIMAKNYWAEIDSNYTLNVNKKVKDITTFVENSAGEYQIASLSFIGSIVSICKENYETKKSKFIKGGIFPLVMDSPFGTLDTLYRTMIGRLIPDLAHQIIVLVSDSQWQGQVQSEMQGRVGKEYSFIYHTTEEMPKEKESNISKRKSIVWGEEYEYTQIKEGYHEE